MDSIRNMRIIILLLAISVFISSCSSPTGEVVRETIREPAGVEIISETTITGVVEEPKEAVEPGEIEDLEKVEESEKVEEEPSIGVEDILSLADKKVQSVKYRYKGPETKDFFYEFTVKGSKIKYILSPVIFIDVEADVYDAIYLDVDSKSAEGHCDAQKCYRRGKKTDLDYDEMYILTAFDWLNKIDSAELLDGEQIDRRSTWRLLTDDFTIWIDSFYGVPLQVESGDEIYIFENIRVNGVKDSDVTPT